MRVHDDAEYPVPPLLYPQEEQLNFWVNRIALPKRRILHHPFNPFHRNLALNDPKDSMVAEFQFHILISVMRMASKNSD